MILSLPLIISISRGTVYEGPRPTTLRISKSPSSGLKDVDRTPSSGAADAWSIDDIAELNHIASQQHA
jgi:hypothetical protein